MDFLKLLPGLVKVFQCISHLLTNKTKLKFDQELKACRSFCFELKVLNKSNDSVPWAFCAFGNVYSTIFGLLVRSKTDNTWTSLLLSALLGLHIFWFWPIGRGEGSATFQSSHRQPNRCLAAPPMPPMPSWSWCPACCWPDWPHWAKNQQRGAGWLRRCTFGDQLPPPIHSVVVVVAARYLLLLTSPGDYDQWNKTKTSALSDLVPRDHEPIIDFSFASDIFEIFNLLWWKFDLKIAPSLPRTSTMAAPYRYTIFKFI